MQRKCIFALTIEFEFERNVQYRQQPVLLTDHRVLLTGSAVSPVQYVQPTSAYNTRSGPVESRRTTQLLSASSAAASTGRPAPVRVVFHCRYFCGCRTEYM